jgi:hypothetical protein
LKSRVADGFGEFSGASPTPAAGVAAGVGEASAEDGDNIPTIRKLNPKKTAGRAYKHFQFLTIEGQAELEQYRDEAVALMKTCTTWYEFRVELFREYSVPYQSELFVR